ncbi:MAG TPA: flagellar biosynthesis protein FlhF [Symbiobacteriaceae bacterium]|nr:flagellar biosynthesis protein FlhF [Symbiobacteriaceae bacterium]
MWIKKFQAPTLQEAVAKVKAELGPEAVILHTTHVKQGGLLGLFASRLIEVTAAVERHPDEERASRPAESPRSVAVPEVKGPVPQAGRPPATAPQRPAPSPPPKALGDAPAGWPAAAAEAYRQAYVTAGSDPAAALDPVLEAPVRPPQSQPTPEPVPVGRFDPRMATHLERLGGELVNVGVGEESAYNLIHRVGLRLTSDPDVSALKVRRMAAHLMAADLAPPGASVAKGRRVIALIGPTGVGKTTTLAKLAAHYVLQENKRVAMVAADTFRVAAVDQLRTYAEILGVPIEVVYEAEEIPGALARTADAEIVLVDTAGRSHRNAGHMDELRRYLGALHADEVHLVLSLTSSERDAQAMIEGYWPYGFDRFLFTKWDESSSPGLIYHLVQRYRRPFSFVTTGQSVPEDIVAANPLRIAEAILGGDAGGQL